MRPKLTLLLAIMIAFASSAYVLVKSNRQNPICGKCIDKKKMTPGDSSGGGNELYEGSFNHFIVSTIK